MLNILKKNASIFKTGFFSILIFLGTFNISYADDWSWSPWKIPSIDSLIDSVLTFIANTMLWVSSQILAMAGILFNYSLEYTLNFKYIVEQTGIVAIGWEVIRDLSNMIFIFLLLFLSIGTILGLSSYNVKNSLKNIIIAALLINFSLFFTSVIIDASNVLAIGFYNATTQDAASTTYSTTDPGSNYDKGISGTFSQALNLSTIYSKDLSDNDAGGAHKNIFMIGLFGSIFLLVTAFVFFAASFLFMIRTVTLMFLMMLSPIAFIGMILPGTKALASKWWNELFSQAFFAPIYLMFIYIVARGINSDGFKDVLGNTGNDNNFADLFTGGGMVMVAFNFLLIIFLMLGALISARSLGVRGAEGMIKTGHSMRKWGQGKTGSATFGAMGRLGRSTVGAGASNLAGRLEDSNHASKWYGKMGLKGLRNVSDSSFDVRNTEIGKAAAGAIPGGLGTGIKGGYKTKTDEQKKSEIKFAQSLKGDITDSDGNTISRTEAYGQKLQDRTIWSSITATTGGNQAAAKALVDLPKQEKELKQAKKDLKVINEDYTTYKKGVADEEWSVKPEEIEEYRNNISNKEDEIEKIKGKITKIKDNAKDKSKDKK